MLISSYDPDNIKINFDNPSSMQANGETIVIPQNITDALNALPPNPNYLPPEQFMDASQKSYIDTWHSIYGIDSKPPQIYWDPVKEQPTYVNQNFRYLIDSSLNRNKNNNNIYYIILINILVKVDCLRLVVLQIYILRPTYPRPKHNFHTATIFLGIYTKELQL